MDFLNATNNLYDWITSIIRRRGLHKSTNTSGGDQSIEQDNFLVEAQIKNVELIPTLNFVVGKPTEIVSLHHAIAIASAKIPQIPESSSANTKDQTKAAGIADAAIADDLSADDSSDNFSKRTFIIANQLNESDSSLLSYSSSDSISIEMDTLGKSTTTTTKETTETESNNQSAATPLSDTSIEEEIEEVISAADSSEVDEQFLKDTNQLPDLLSVSDFVKSSEKSKSLHLRKGKESTFEIDVDQLSGGKLKQHFVGDDDDEILCLPIEHEASETSKQNSAGCEAGSLPSNQSTANDVSDLLDESNQDSDFPQLTLSLPEGGASALPAFERRSCASLDSAVNFINLSHSQKMELESSPEHSEKDHSIEEIFQINQSIEVGEGQAEDVKVGNQNDDDDDDDNSKGMELMKQRLKAMKTVKESTFPPIESTESCAVSPESGQQQMIVKQMERMSSEEHNKDVLEDITEESEKISISVTENHLPNAGDHLAEKSEESSQRTLVQTKSAGSNSTISLNMIRRIENENAAIAAPVPTSSATSSTDQQPPSGRDSGSCTSTEYRTFNDDVTGGVAMDIFIELSKRDKIITELSNSLHQSISVRENLQLESEKLTNEVQMLRKQLTEAIDLTRRQYWPSDQESNGGQRISEISIDLVSHEDDEDEDGDRNFLTDNEDIRQSRDSRERQLSMPRQTQDVCDAGLESPYDTALAVSKQIELFQKYLDPSELRLFFMVQKKFDDFLSAELEKTKMKYETEMKILSDELEAKNRERESDINNLRETLNQELRQEMKMSHAKEMEDLRLYFEKKCVELEKQYSDEVFSQKSQRRSSDTCSDFSDQDNMPEEIASPPPPMHSHLITKELMSPRKKKLLSSPSHRQLTPSGDANPNGSRNQELVDEMTEMKFFYQSKIQEIKRQQESVVRRLNEKIKYFENRYPEDEFMDEMNLNNETQVFKIIDDYDRRLQEQVALAREDIVRELADKIQSYLSETTTDDRHWPPELILLREKFTAKSQLEIAQLQIKHEEEMSRLKKDYEKQINRKQKRNSHFDSCRDLHQVISERDGYRELSKTFRHVLAELAKCVNVCETDINVTLVKEMQKFLANRSGHQTEHELLDLNLSDGLSILETTNNQYVRLVPDVNPLLRVVEDPQLMEFISTSASPADSNANANDDEFDLKECLERLNTEAMYLLQLSEDINRKRTRNSSESSEEKNDNSCVIDDCPQKSSAILLNQNLFQESLQQQQHQQQLSAHPSDINRLKNDDESITIASSELNFQVHELKNRLVKSETDRFKLQQELEQTIKRNTELGHELAGLRDQLNQFDSSQNEEYTQGYGLALIKSPQRNSIEKMDTSFAQLQEKARNILTTPTQQNSNATTLLLQMIEDFCREGDKVVENGKKDRDDLQSQIDNADKQLKATRKFLEEQAAEHEQERADFLKEIEKLKTYIREKEKERSSYENASKEVEQLEHQNRDLKQILADSEMKKENVETELKLSIDKIFVLREIITNLETKIETKALNEQVLEAKVLQLNDYIATLDRTNDTLQEEVENLKVEIEDYQDKIRFLEEKLQNIRPPPEQSLILDQVVEKLHDIEITLDAKTKTLETLHHSVSSISCCSTTSAVEDVSAQTTTKPVPPSTTTTAQSLPLLPLQLASQKSTATVSPPQGSPVHPSPRQHTLQIEGVQRVLEKLSKHSRIEEAAIKRIRDLEMHVADMRSSCVELQHERDALQEKMSDQMQRISTLQSRLEEQRQRAEELQRIGTSDLHIRIHDLQNELVTVKETLSARDKQIATMKNQLEKGKSVIDRLEAEVTVATQPDRSAIERLEVELKTQKLENQKLNQKIKSEMIDKRSLPDLIETMLAEKNDEIDYLKEQLELKEKELQEAQLSRPSKAVGGGEEIAIDASKDEASTKLSARTLSDIVSISEFDEPDLIRRAVVNDLGTPLTIPRDRSQSSETSKVAVADLTAKRSADLAAFKGLRPQSTFDHPHYFQNPNLAIATKNGRNVSTNTPPMVPRQINFSTECSSDDSRPNLINTMASSAQHLASIEKLRAEKNAQIEKLQTQLQETKLMAKEDSATLIAELKQQIQCKDCDLKNLEEELIGTQLRLGGLHDELDKKTIEMSNLKVDNQRMAILEQKINENIHEIEVLEQLNREKTDTITKHEKNLANYQQNEERYLRRIADLEENIHELKKSVRFAESRCDQLNSSVSELAELRKLNEKCAADIAECKRQMTELNAELQQKNENIFVLTSKLSSEERHVSMLQEKTASMEKEIEKLRQQQQQNSDNSKQFSVDEIAQQVETELNYSAQLDSKILKAIESEEENNLNQGQGVGKIESSDDDNFGVTERDMLNQLEALRAQIQIERQLSEELRKELVIEKQHSQEIQEQDVAIIEAMRKRLENALTKEEEFQQILDEEREKCDRLMTQITVFQRAEARKCSGGVATLLKSPTDSPQRKSPRASDLESDHHQQQIDRLKSEIKLLISQNERERERGADLQKNFDRERSRFETELTDRVEYCERLKREMDKVSRDKIFAEQEVDNLQERLSVQSLEIQSLEARIAALQESETRRVSRRDRQRLETTQTVIEMQDLKLKIANLETERDHLTHTIELLRHDIDCGAQREIKLTEALAATQYSNVAAAEIPQQFLQKMKEINALLMENTKENRQSAETLQFLDNERRMLQKRCEELEAQLNSNANSNVNVAELEERANYLLGRYLRVESHRKALVYQKRYLKISLQSYQASEERAKMLINGEITGTGVLMPKRPDRRRLFKSVALAIIAIQRMKFIGRVWQTGKRIVSKSVFTITQQRRPTHLINNNNNEPPTISTSPPCRDSPLHSPFNLVYRPLQTPALLNECTQKFDWSRLQQQHHRQQQTRQQQQQQQQKNHQHQLP